MGFNPRAARASEQTDMETCRVLVVAWHLFSPVKNHTPQNMSLETRTSKLTTHGNMSSFSKQPDTRFDAWAIRALGTYPTETCNISRAMFRPHPPIFHVPPCNPHPQPIHDALDLFSTLHRCCVFFCRILTSSLMFPC